MNSLRLLMNSVQDIIVHETVYLFKDEAFEWLKTELIERF